MTKHPARPLSAPRNPRGTRLLAAAIAACLCTPAVAQNVPSDEEVARAVDAFNPYASLGYGYDSNIYRLDDDAPDIGDRDDHYAMLAAGLNADLHRALQRYELYAEANHTFFMNHDDLDYTGSKAGAIWHWAASEQTTGTLGITHRRALRDFANQPSLEKVKDLRMENKVLASADFDVGGPWRFGVRGDFADVSFSETDRLDLQRSTVGGSLGYASSAGSVIGIEGEYIQGNYDNNPLADYDEYTVGPTLDWRFTERSSLTAKLGYTSRDVTDPQREDYDGLTGRVSVNFDNGERNGLSLAVYRELSNLGDEVSDFAAITGIEFEPRWQLREGIDLRLVVGYEQRDFNPDPDAELLGLDPDRDDDVFTAGAYVDWELTRHIKLTMGVDGQKRESTRPLQDYDFGRVELRIVGTL